MKRLMAICMSVLMCVSMTIPYLTPEVTTKAEEKTVASIEIKQEPKNEYYQYVDTNYSFKGLQVEVTYDDKTTETLNYGEISQTGKAIIISSSLELDPDKTISEKDQWYDFIVSLDGKTDTYNAKLLGFESATKQSLQFGTTTTISGANYAKGNLYEFTAPSGGMLAQLSSDAQYLIYDEDMNIVFNKVYDNEKKETLEIDNLIAGNRYYFVATPLQDSTKESYEFNIRAYGAVDGLSVVKAPSKTVYQAETTSTTDIDVSDAIVRVHYANGYEEDVPMSKGYNFYGRWFSFDTSDIVVGDDGKIVPGTYNFKICLEGKETVIPMSFVMQLNNIEDANITGVSNQTFDGTEKKPSVKVDYFGKTLLKDTDYTVTYSNNVNAGIATITVTGKGDYSGSKSINFSINKMNLSNGSLTLSRKSFVYNGKTQSPSVAVKVGNRTLSTADYNVTYANNKMAGIARVTVTGKGNYEGSKSATYIIYPGKVTGVKLTKKKKSFKAKWSKRSEATGYEVWVSTKKKSKFKKKATITKNKTTSKTIKKLKAKKNYYVKVRAYKTVGKTKYYGSFSSVKKVKTK